MIEQGKYSVSFKTPVGEGAGTVELGSDGKLIGGDATFAYIGNWSCDGAKFRAALNARRVVAGPPGVFGLDNLDIIISGLGDGTAISCRGFAKQSPGIVLDVVLTPD